MTSSNPTRTLGVLIVDRRGFDRSALAALCAEEEELTVIGATDDTEQACRALAGAAGETVALVGRTLLRRDGPALISHLRACHPAVRILLVGTAADDGLRLEAVRINADGFLRRDGDADEQLGAIRGEAGTVPRWNGTPGHPGVS